MKISIIVPVYNIEKYIRKCLESLINQNYDDIEIIVVDDGSTDSSGLICDEIGAKDKRIKVIHKENGGVVSARKAALPYLTGDYVCNVDGDDWVEADFIFKYVNAIMISNSSLIWNVAFTKDFEDRLELQKPSGIDKDTINDKASKMWTMDMLYGQYGFQNEIDYSNCFVCVKRELYIKNQSLITEKIWRGEDLIFALNLLISTDSLDFIFNSGYHYVQRRNSVTNNTSRYSINEFFLLKEAFNELANRAGKYKTGIELIGDGYCGITYMNYLFGTHEEEEYLYPFIKVKKGSRIVVYGAGNIGKNIVRHLVDNDKYYLTGWVNTTSVIDNILGIDIKLVQDIKQFEFDYVIIATNRMIYANQMKSSLIKYEVDKEKIVSIFDKEVDLG